MTEPRRAAPPTRASVLHRSARARRALRLLRSLTPPAFRPVVAYASAPAAVLLAAAAQYVLLPEPLIAPFVLFYLGIAFVAWIGGRGPGLLTVLISAAAANWLFIPPYRQLSLSGPARTTTLLFVVSSSAIACLCAAFRDALLEADRSAARLRRQGASLQRSAAAARESEILYRTLFNSIDEGFCTVDMLFDAAGKPADYRFIEVNQAFDRQTGLPGAAGKLMRTLAPSHEEYWFETFGRVALTGEPTRFEGYAAALGRWYDVYAFRVGEAEHRRVGIIFNDITARKRSEDAVREANQRKTEFLGVLSHELRNPLSPIRNSIYITGRAPPGSEQARRALAVIDRQVHQLTRLVDDLLDVTRIAHGKIRLKRERVDLNALASHVAEDYRFTFEKNDLELKVRLADEPLFVNADPTRLAQIIGNLLHNAAKFTPRGSWTALSIRRVDEHDAEFTVQDNGPGIPPEVLATLFEPFVQAERTLERSSGGLGLGLALVKGLVELHGGSVSARSAGPGQGAAFSVRVPVERRRADRLASVVAPPMASSAARRVLVIEDSIDAAETLKEVLELNDYVVAVAYGGSEGVRKARAFKPDVVLCDIGLPDMNGFEVARTLRADAELHSAKLVALSGYALPEDVDKAKAAGFDLHLAKPPDLSVLEQSIAEARVIAETA
jgi:signal transduction histidine kinase/CheY-like chemotaxis protein